MRENKGKVATTTRLGEAHYNAETMTCRECQSDQFAEDSSRMTLCNELHRIALHSTIHVLHIIKKVCMLKEGVMTTSLSLCEPVLSAHECALQPLVTLQIPS